MQNNKITSKGKDCLNHKMRYSVKIKTLTLKISEPVNSDKTTSVTSDDIAYRTLSAIYRRLDDDQEHFTVLFLDQNLKVIGYKTLFSGGKASSIVDMTILFRNVLLFGAAQIIIAHNHPTGNLKPSKADLIITEKIRNAGKLIDIDVIDHLIVTKKSFYSLKEHNLGGFYRN